MQSGSVLRQSGLVNPTVLVSPIHQIGFSLFDCVQQSMSIVGERDIQVCVTPPRESERLDKARTALFQRYIWNTV